ncbi:MAG: polysaccharide pyruvyl transferase family protein [Clostridia bacterium]|nr:polysaccharide pyruvyl transferase family protein [Clostridia bacterium]
MKIGIITHHSINNFGAFLQGWALQEKIKALFPQDEVYIVNYRMPKQDIINIGGFFRFYPGTETLKSWLHKISQPLIFAKTRKQYLHTTKRVRNAAGINALGLDCIVVGSDEVWNYLDPKSFSLVKYGGGLNCKRLVSYAPSTGKATGEDAPQEVRAAMQAFTALSARDKGAQTLCRNALGITPPLVCDPTFLTAFPAADTEKIRQLTQKPYVLFYYCNGIPRDLKKKLADNARAKGYEVLGAGEYDTLYSQMSVRLTAFEWVELFRRAEYVYTGTFHGVVFSILNRKNFRVYASIDSRVKKIAALLEQFGIGDRTLREPLPQEDESIDYDAVYRYVEDLRRQSSDYLLRAIRGEQTEGEENA